MKQIVVATDFSNCAGNAMEYAVELARILNAEICVIHAIHPTEGIDNNVYKAIFIEDYYKSKRQSLEAWVAGFLTKDEHKVIKITTLCQVGFLTNVLHKYINSHPVELLVMAITGTTGINGLSLRNAGLVISKINVPILILPSGSRFLPNPVITIATDFASALSIDNVTLLNTLVEAFNSGELHVLNIVEAPQWRTNNIGENKMQALINNTVLDFKYIAESSTTDGIMRFIRSNGTDILCLVKHHHNFIYRLFTRSKVVRIIRQSTKAVIVLHAGKTQYN